MALLCCFLASVLAVPVEQYTDKYDNVDLDEVFLNPKLFNGYVDCVLDKGPCTPDGKELRHNLPDALQTGCEKCTKKQENGVITVIKHLIEKKPDTWKELTEKYDPEGIWKKKYEDQAKEKGIKLP
ncbi:unnamed protein product, partial [Brenthis ino]